MTPYNEQLLMIIDCFTKIREANCIIPKAQLSTFVKVLLERIDTLYGENSDKNHCIDRVKESINHHYRDAVYMGDKRKSWLPTKNIFLDGVLESLKNSL